jgi:hypothetical protein
MIRREKPAEQPIPAELSAIAKEAMFWQVASSYTEERYKEVKGDFFQQIESHPSIEMVAGKSLKVPTGKVRWQVKENFDVLQSEIENAITSGRITVPVLLGLVRSYDMENLKQFIPSAVVPSAAKPTTEYGVMQATPEYKAQVKEQVDALLQIGEPGDNVAVMPAAEPDLTAELEASLADATAKKAAKPARKKVPATA